MFFSRRILTALLFVFCFFSLPLYAETPPGVYIRYDFSAHFDDATLDNCSAHEANSNQTAGMRSMAGFLLHPGPQGDAIANFPPVHVEDDPGARPFLLFHTGIRDGIDWTSERANKPNGVSFSVAIDGVRVFEETLAECRWRAHALDLGPWRGKDIGIAFGTNAVGGDTNYDWAVFGGATLVAVYPVADVTAFPEGANGLALARVTCTAPTNVTLSVGAARLETALQPGECWLPLEFDACAAPVLEGEGTRLEETLLAPYLPALEIRQMELSSPLLNATRPFQIVAQIENTGRGKSAAGIAVPELFKVVAPALGPGQRAWVATAPIVTPRESATSTPAGMVHIFGFEESCGVQPLSSACAAVHENKTVRAMAGNSRCRVTIIAGKDRQAYGHLDIWNGMKWKRAGSMYPLASLSLNGLPAEPMQLTQCTAEGNALSLAFADMKKNTALVRFEADANAPRIRVSAEFTAMAESSLYAFEGPSLLAGDRAFGAKKDFAVFSGLEYLEGDEDSSSERDLAYPLSDRRIPALHKIASGVMAVQSAKLLVAMLWNPWQEWAAGQHGPAARFNAPKVETGIEYIRMGLRAPGVGEYLDENTLEAKQPLALTAGGGVRLEWCLVLDHANYQGDSPVVAGPHRGGLLLQAYRHYFDLFGLPEPSAQPRSWEEEMALCLKGYLDATWESNPPGWKHCFGWQAYATAGPDVPLSMLARQQSDAAVRDEILRRIEAVDNRVLTEQGPGAFIGATNCHIVLGEPVFHWGYASETIGAFGQHARGLLDARENGMWVWRPSANDAKMATLGDAGGHTLGQAAHSAMAAIRAARFSGDRSLMADALDAMRQMEQYEVPRGAQMWECPMYQPDILAAAYAIRAYCDAFRMTGDPAHLAQARYWAWTGLPFLYLWDMPGYPTMRYNVVSVIGSTFYTHSWLGLPVVWCGLVYAYALQDLAEFDDSLDWRRIAQGICNSAMWQQYTTGPNAGTYPDSWDMIKNAPNPADINPENIIMNECRLRDTETPGRISPEPAFKRVDCAGGPVFINSAADISSVEGIPESGAMKIRLETGAGWPGYTTIAPIGRPAGVEGAGMEAAASAPLREAAEGWMYDESHGMLVIKNGFAEGIAEITLH